MPFPHILSGCRLAPPRVKRHVKPTAQRPGGILEVEAPLALSKLMLIDPSSGKPTKVKFKVEGGKKSRVGKDGAALPAPVKG